MNSLESRCAQAYGDKDTDPDWTWEPPISPTPLPPNTRTKLPPRQLFPKKTTHPIRLPGGQFFCYLPKKYGPLIPPRQPGSQEPEHVKLDYLNTEDTPTFAELNTEKQLAAVSKLAAKLGVSFDDAGRSTTNDRTQTLKDIAARLGAVKVVHREGKAHQDPGEFLHYNDDRIVTGPTVSGEYQVIRTAVQTDRFYGR